MSIKLSPNGTKTLKFFHLLFACMWFGGGAALTLFTSFVLPKNPQEALIYSKILDFIDWWLIVMGANGSLVTALVYSIWTNWGFFKHKWIAFKWIVFILQIVYGTFVLGPWVTGNLKIAEAMTGNISQYPDFFKNLHNISIGGSIQLVLIVVFIYISIFKPWNKKSVKAKN